MDGGREGLRRRRGRGPGPHGAAALRDRVLVRDLPARAGSVVRLCGWAHTVDDRGLALRDHTGLVELVAHEGLGEVTPESAIEVEGTVVDGGARVELRRLEVLGSAEAPLPVDEASPLDERLDWRYLDLRRPRNRLVFEVQTTVERAMREWWAAHDFLELHSPRFRAMPNMSGRELFTVDYFGRLAYLAQSPQFYKQMAMAAGFERVFEVGPVFRANPLLTPRHDTEFVSVDVEVSWIESHEDLMDLEERWLCHVVATVERRHGAEVARLFGRTVQVPDTPFPRLTMAEAQRILARRGHRPSAPEGDIDAAGERLLAEHVAETFGHPLVFVTEYPEAVRPFYHMRLDDGSAATRSFDLLWNGLEVTTGAQREHRYERLVAQAGRNPSRVDVIRPYLDFFRHGCPPHGGFGVGLTRLLTCLLGVGDVREVTFLPRDRERLTP
ncbi:MAG TPA: aspartate--tRNA(Asn) ligase [Acidimicrobiales bacterium]|nr:aspartate--tRNA(Asn) ligase [Acidimicrobiales bacterium]